MAMCKTTLSVMGNQLLAARLSLTARYRAVLQILFLAFRGFTGARGRAGNVGALSCVTLADAGRFTTQSTQVIKLSAPHVTFLNYINVVDDCGVQRKDSFDANTKAGLAHGNRLARAAMLAGNADAFKSLQALFGFRLFDPYVHAHRVAWLKIRNVIS